MLAHGFDVAARVAPSFGWDFTSLVVYQLGNSAERVLRVAVSDPACDAVDKTSIALRHWLLALNKNLKAT